MSPPIFRPVLYRSARELRRVERPKAGYQLNGFRMRALLRARPAGDSDGSQEYTKTSQSINGLSEGDPRRCVRGKSSAGFATHTFYVKTTSDWGGPENIGMATKGRTTSVVGHVSLLMERARHRDRLTLKTPGIAFCLQNGHTGYQNRRRG
jgi:hypothetical protein